MGWFSEMTCTSGSVDADLLFHFVLTWRGRSCLAPFILMHCFTVPSLAVPHCCIGICFGRRILIARNITCLFALLNLREG